MNLYSISSSTSSFFLKVFLICLLFPFTDIHTQSNWNELESPNFKLIYRDTHSHLAQHILNSAENSLNRLIDIFEFSPTEKIVINTYDIYDYGFASATSVPKNFIRLEIEPFEQGYENIPFNERFQWVLSHEIVHIMVNDQPSKAEEIFRTIFGKVAPEQIQPMTIFYSLLTNYSRYTPRWHQEAIAVFMETWLSGGYGRILGNFDEMYFRSLVYENRSFPTDLSLETRITHDSFLLETLFYMYGGRFAAYLSSMYDNKKILKWFSAKENYFYESMYGKFENIFEIDFDDAWEDFIQNEKDFQKNNINKIIQTPITKIRRLAENNFGMVSQPHYDTEKKKIYFANHQPHQLAGINEFDQDGLNFREIATLPTPSMYQVASTAYYKEKNLFFFTTNNNQLFRDIWSLNVKTFSKKLLFSDSRIGQLSVSDKGELWGIQHSGGGAVLVYSNYPYKNYKSLFAFEIGDEIAQLSVDPAGNQLAITIHKKTGEQHLAVAQCKAILNSEGMSINIISSKGSPENPSWSKDGKFLYWNAYTNGVSNIYKSRIDEPEIIPISNVVTGLFKPIEISDDSLFVFEFSSEGLYPAMIANKNAGNLYAINYFGQQIINKHPKVNEWTLDYNYQLDAASISVPKEYNSLSSIQFLTFIPVISGFQDQKVLGLYARLSDPLINHDITIEAGYSPFNKNPSAPKFHLKFKYEFLKQWEIGIEHNAPDFYDLFNERKKGTIGSKYKIGNTFYWIYDNPLKVKQQTEVTLYRGIQFFNDNLTKITEPDFLVVSSNFNSKNLRRSIGSSDFEDGNEFNLTALGFGADPKNPEYSAQFFAEWDHYTTWLLNHNIFHFKLASGYHIKNENLIQSKFFFGGFGNRIIENTEVRQFRKVFRFPGLPIYSFEANHFGKIMLENALPPLRFGANLIGPHILNHIDIAFYGQGLLVDSNKPRPDGLLSVGSQIDFIFKHWSNLESTLSAGIAKAFTPYSNSWEWFISYKLLRN